MKLFYSSILCKILYQVKRINTNYKLAEINNNRKSDTILMFLINLISNIINFVLSINCNNEQK